MKSTSKNNTYLFRLCYGTWNVPTNFLYLIVSSQTLLKSKLCLFSYYSASDNSCDLPLSQPNPTRRFNRLFIVNEAATMQIYSKCDNSLCVAYTQGICAISYLIIVGLSVFMKNIHDHTSNV